MIGIVGGVGPYAGIDLLKKVFDNTLAGLDQDHVDAVLFSLPASILDRTEFLVGKVAENPAYAISKVAIKLEAAGASVAGIPCNTAHVERIFKVIRDELEKAGSAIRLLNMIEETADFIGRALPAYRKIGVLSTTGTYRSGVYKKILEKRGYEVLRPTDSMQETLIHPAIYHPDYGIKAVSNPVHATARENLHRGFKYLRENGAEAVILACTEIPIAFPEKEVEGMVTVDPTLVLARSLVRHDCPKKLKPLIS